MSLKKIQKLTGFSPSTISRVLNNNNEYRFHESTRRIVLEAADKIDYRPNSVARSLRLKKTMIIGLIVSDIKNSFFSELASWIEMRLGKHGYSTILYDTNEDLENEEHYHHHPHPYRRVGFVKEYQKRDSRGPGRPNFQRHRSSPGDR